MKKRTQRLPKGWTLKDVQEIIAYYDNQTEEAAAKEIETALEAEAVVLVPHKLLPRVRKMIAESHR